MQTFYWKFLLSLHIILFLFLSLFKDNKLPLDKVVVVEKKEGIYYDEYELIIPQDQENPLRLQMENSSKKYRLQKHLGRWFLQVNKKPYLKISASAGQRGFYRFFQMNGRLCLVDILESCYIVNRDPDIFLKQIYRTLHDSDIEEINKQGKTAEIIKEIHERAHKIIGSARNISEYTKFNEMKWKIYIVKDHLAPINHVDDILKHGPDVGVFLILWGNEINFSSLASNFRNIFLFKGKGLMQNSVLSRNECLYIRNKFCKRIIVSDKICRNEEF
jgi:hypothetical protein